MSRLAIAFLSLTACCWVVGCTAKSAPSVPATPEGTVETVAKALADKQPGVIWNALPASYQKDVNGLIQLFAQKMDKEVYDKSFEVLNKAIKVLGDKKDFILGHPMLAEGPMKKDELKQNWDSVVGMFRTLTGSEIRTLASLKSLDVGKFLSGTGAKIMAQASQVSKAAKDDEMGKALDKLSKIKVEVVESGADAAKLRVTMPDETPE
ncbi:MAG: hypothetical protein OIN84_19510, partial [Candidatus Methanoperedens sp.]|nr:hypothetical protein [Candidatus Methanoperedens sp.]